MSLVIAILLLVVVAVVLLIMILVAVMSWVREEGKRRADPPEQSWIRRPGHDAGRWVTQPTGSSASHRPPRVDVVRTPPAQSEPLAPRSFIVNRYGEIEEWPRLATTNRYGEFEEDSE